MVGIQLTESFFPALASNELEGPIEGRTSEEEKGG